MAIHNSFVLLYSLTHRNLSNMADINTDFLMHFLEKKTRPSSSVHIFVKVIPELMVTKLKDIHMSSCLDTCNTSPNFWSRATNNLWFYSEWRLKYVCYDEFYEYREIEKITLTTRTKIVRLEFTSFVAEYWCIPKIWQGNAMTWNEVDVDYKTGLVLVK